MVSKGMAMGRGFRLTLQLVVTVAAAAVVARATESARRAVHQAALDPPRHRAEIDRPAVQPAPHPFGPELATPCRSIDHTPQEVIELEASGELDDALSPTDRLLARRHALDEPTSDSARDAPTPSHRYG
jgi:hypothetical protein